MGTFWYSTQDSVLTEKNMTKCNVTLIIGRTESGHSADSVCPNEGNYIGFFFFFLSKFLKKNQIYYQISQIWSQNSV